MRAQRFPVEPLSTLRRELRVGRGLVPASELTAYCLITSICAMNSSLALALACFLLAVSSCTPFLKQFLLFLLHPQQRPQPSTLLRGRKQGSASPHGGMQLGHPSVPAPRGHLPNWRVSQQSPELSKVCFKKNMLSSESGKLDLLYVCA